MTEDEIDDIPSEISSKDTVDVPHVGSMAEMPPQVAEAIARELARAVVERKIQKEELQVIDIESLPIDIMGVLPRYDRWHWFKGWKKDPTNENRVIYDLYVVNQRISKILAKSLQTISTKWGPEKTKAFFIWTVTRARTYDPNNKRVVPIRQIVMTSLMARRGADVTKLLDMLTPKVIKKSVDLIQRHESLVWADVAKMTAQEAETAWAIVDKKADSHFKATERMLKYAGEAEDKGDEAFAKSFTEDKNLKQNLKDNWCIILILIIVVIYLIGYAQGWWGT